jgi:predicted nucleic acid-binding protein
MVEKLVEKFGFDAERAAQAAQEVKAISELVSVTGSLRAVDADPDDDVVVECALLGGAAYIVTGDRHLIDLGQYASIEIVRPAWFVTMVDSPT